MIAVTEFAAASINGEQTRLLVTPYRDCLMFQMEHRTPEGAVVHVMKLELARDTVDDLAKFVERWSQTVAALDNDGVATHPPEGAS
jgi:hypothetical protein